MSSLFFKFLGLSLASPFFFQLFALDSTKWPLFFQEPATPVMEKIIDLHNEIMMIMFFIVSFVLLTIIYAIIRFRASKNKVPSKRAHNPVLEIIWTIIPACIVLFIGFSSLKLLFYMDKAPQKEDLVIKVIGRQWYWSYEYMDQKIAFDSYMKQDKDLKPGDLRLLSVDNPIVVPVNSVVKLIVTSSDVIHSWAMPAFGVKKDAIIGRLNETWFQAIKIGTYYGQCSELCGAGHAFMPIEVRVVSKEDYEAWLKNAKKKFSANQDIKINNQLTHLVKP